MRRATLQDLAFLAAMDLEADREDARGAPLYFQGWGEPEHQAHRERLAGFVCGPLAWVEEGRGLVLGALYGQGEGTAVHLPALSALLPPGARYAEVFQLWVHAGARRQGLGRALKLQLEQSAREQGAVLVYTHTRARNEHVLALNRGLGYEELRRGPMWDEVERVSLVKRLTARGRRSSGAS
jgi:ribosomal protein S18 acetylase RimI-like enzyme